MKNIRIGDQNCDFFEGETVESYTCLIASGNQISNAMLSKCPGKIEVLNRINPDLDWWVFNRLKVDPELRNRGIGTSLLERVKAFAERRGIAIICEINTYSPADQEKRANFYIHRGFNKLDTDTVYYIPQKSHI